MVVVVVVVVVVADGISIHINPNLSEDDTKFLKTPNQKPATTLRILSTEQSMLCSRVRWCLCVCVDECVDVF